MSGQSTPIPVERPQERRALKVVKEVTVVKELQVLTKPKGFTRTHAREQKPLDRNNGRTT